MRGNQYKKRFIESSKKNGVSGIVDFIKSKRTTVLNTNELFRLTGGVDPLPVGGGPPPPDCNGE